MRTTVLVAALTFFVGSNAIAQNKTNTEKIAAIFPADQFASKVELQSFYKRLLDERIQIEYLPLSNEDKFPLLSTVPLNNKYNSSIKSLSEEDFDSATFNVLAYQLPFFDTGSYVHIYRIDRSDYILKILPQ